MALHNALLYAAQTMKQKQPMHMGTFLRENCIVMLLLLFCYGKYANALLHNSRDDLRRENTIWMTQLC